MYSTSCGHVQSQHITHLSNQAWVKRYQVHYTLFSSRSKAGLSTVSCATRVTAATTSPLVTLHQYDDFELLWLEYRQDLSISKEAALWTLEDVQLGLLPCDAELLRDRAQRFISLSQEINNLDSRRLLNTSRSLLLHDSNHMQETVKRLLRLQPRTNTSNPTQLVMDTAADLDLPPEVLALQYQELGTLFQARLGAWIPDKALHYLLQRLRKQQHQLAAPTSAQAAANSRQQMSKDSAFKQLLETSAGVTEQLDTLKLLMGAELAHAAVSNTPELLDASALQVQASLQWLQHQLRLTPVAALLLAEQQGQVLLLPAVRLEQNYSNICYLLQQLVGWRLQQVHSLMCNAPELLIKHSQQLAGNWQRVQRLSKRRLAWMKELAAAEGPLLTAVLSCSRRQLLMLQYAADTGELQGRGLLQIFRMDYADFMKVCPGFRTWRSMAPGRWRIVTGPRGDSSSVGGDDSSLQLGATENSVLWPVGGLSAAAGSRAGQEAANRNGNSGGNTISSGSSSKASTEQVPFGRVLAADNHNRPILVQVGELGPYDRLA